MERPEVVLEGRPRIVPELVWVSETVQHVLWTPLPHLLYQVGVNQKAAWDMPLARGYSLQRPLGLTQKAACPLGLAPHAVHLFPIEKSDQLSRKMTKEKGTLLNASFTRFLGRAVASLCRFCIFSSCASQCLHVF